MRAKDPDYFLISIVFLLTIVGLLVLFSASSAKAAFTYGSASYYVMRQILYGVVPGLSLLAIFYLLNPRWLRKLAVIMFLFSVAMLLLVLIPEFGLTIKGATRWLRIGNISFQPAEFFKLTFIVYLASFFARRQSKISNFYEVTLPFFVFLGICGFLLLSQPATGTFGIIVLIAFSMYFFSGVRLSSILVSLLFLAFAFTFLIIISPYRMERLATFLNPEKDPRGAGYQITQALIAIGSGGFDGVGFGHSKQKYNFLPETIGDSIFAIYAEETGFLGSIGLILLFILFLYISLNVLACLFLNPYLTPSYLARLELASDGAII